MEIAEGVWQLKIPMRYNPLGCTYSYLLIDAVTLIDTGVGTSEARSALGEQLREAGLKISDIENIILTHLHRDHVGLVEYIKSVSGAEVYAHERAAELLKMMAGRGKKEFHDMRKEMKMLGGGGLLKLLGRFERSFRRRPTSFCIDKTLVDGGQLGLRGSILRVIWTPGHASEQICLYDADRRLLFSGDHVLPEITSHVSLHTHRDSDPLGDYINSLEKVRRLLVNLVLPGHEYVFGELEERIEELKRHHENRCREIKETLREREKTVFQISEKISWSSRPWPLMTLWTKRMAAAETLAHLVYLRNRGEIKEMLSNGILYYSLAQKPTN